MQTVAGRSPAQFEREWRISIEGKFSMARILRIGRLVAAVIWPLLILAAYLAFRRRRKRMIDRYAQDEWEEANWRDWGGRP